MAEYRRKPGVVDWVVRRGNGDVHVLTPDVFAQVYEKD